MQYNQSAARARAIDYSRQGIVITDPTQPDNPIVDVNPAFEVMTGYTKADIIGKNCRFLQGHDDSQPERAALRQAVQDRTHARVEIKNFRKDGSMFWNELTISPVFNDEGTLINFIGIQQDITDRKIAQSELLEANQKLVQYNEALTLQANQQRTIDDRINSLLMQSGFTKGYN